MIYNKSNNNNITKRDKFISLKYLIKKLKHSILNKLNVGKEY